jgi:hypothetical protein
VLDRRNQSHKQITAYQFSRLEDPKFSLDAVEDVKVLLASGWLESSPSSNFMISQQNI